jgi:hypothetical protein
MKYFGKGSLSSAMSVALRIAFVLAVAAGLVAMVFGVLIVFHAQFGTPFEGGKATSSAKDIRDWEWFQGLPLALRVLLIPYFAAVVGLVIAIIWKARRLFMNFREERIFDLANVAGIREISKLVIILSILGFSLGSFLIGIILLLVCEILRSGTALKAEQDLTI